MLWDKLNAAERAAVFDSSIPEVMRTVERARVLVMDILDDHFSERDTKSIDACTAGRIKAHLDIANDLLWQSGIVYALTVADMDHMSGARYVLEAAESAAEAVQAEAAIDAASRRISESRAPSEERAAAQRALSDLRQLDDAEIIRRLSVQSERPA